MELNAFLPDSEPRAIKIQGLTRSVFVQGTGTPVMLCHGFPDTVATWHGLAPRLAAQGYQVFMPVSRGYEASSIDPASDYSIAALAEDTVALARALDVGRLHLIGHDWGGISGFGAVALAPDVFRSFTTLAVPHPGAMGAQILTNPAQLRRSWYMYLFQMPGFSDMVVLANQGAFLTSLWRDWSPDWDFDADRHGAHAHDAMRATLTQPGCLSAALGYYRAMFNPAHPRASDNAQLWATPIQVPVLGLYGARDGCIGPDVFHAAMSAAPIDGGARLAEISHAGHFMHLEQPAAVADVVLDFLGQV